ncbi:MAG TPA: NAD(P)/FAD-dependent oxidoreductase [Caulobacteraceae bacterium]|nr:NAD(P)/FAD-dependent oxidoreductase [Caulobacteraceae bacterium]
MPLDFATNLDEAIDAAHLPALMTALVHLTGNTHHLKPEWRPQYQPLDRNNIGVPDEEQAIMRAFAKGVITDFLEGRREPIGDLASEAIRPMMDYITGVDIPRDYLDYLEDELAITGENSKSPRWDSPKLKAAAAKMKVLVIGAGMSGLLAGIRLGQAGVPYEIVEKNADVGGTWLENTYPGCRVDSSNHMYSYSFEPNHLWPQHFSTQPVLLDYFRGVADRYELKKHIRFETEVEEMALDEARQVWRVKLRLKDGREEWVEATAVITAVGQLNRPRYPDIPGRDTFKGASFHSARWDHGVDLEDKRVAVIGTGASAFQFVPEIVGKVGSLEVFQRTPPWCFPTPHYHEDVADGKKWLLETIPFYDRWYRFWLLWMATDGLLPAVQADPDWKGPPTAVSEANQAFRDMVAEMLRGQVANRPDLAEKVVPEYPLGGKRALLDNGVWLQALQQPHVSLVTEAITKIDETGIVTADGAHHDCDVLIYGTGFTASRFLSPMKIKGGGGADLHETWAGDPRAYLGMTTPGFPNLFMIYGPNTNIVVNGSIIFFSECSVRYILGCLELLAETGARTLEVKKDVHDAFNERVDAANKLMAWGAPNVTSWYKNEAGRVTQNWPFALVDYWRATLKPDPADFTLKSAALEPA